MKNRPIYKSNIITIRKPTAEEIRRTEASDQPIEPIEQGPEQKQQ